MLPMIQLISLVRIKIRLNPYFAESPIVNPLHPYIGMMHVAPQCFQGPPESFNSPTTLKHLCLPLEYMGAILPWFEGPLTEIMGLPIRHLKPQKEKRGKRQRKDLIQFLKQNLLIFVIKNGSSLEWALKVQG